MSTKRFTSHPILAIPESDEFAFTWGGTPLSGREGEMVSSALFANGIRAQEKQVDLPTVYENAPLPGEAVICRCERITTSEIRFGYRSRRPDRRYVLPGRRVYLSLADDQRVYPKSP
jgi:hypothetical protein